MTGVFRLASEDPDRHALSRLHDVREERVGGRSVPKIKLGLLCGPRRQPNQLAAVGDQGPIVMTATSKTPLPTFVATNIGWWI